MQDSQKHRRFFLTNIIVGLDIGTSFVRGVLGAINEDGGVEILCVAKKPSVDFIRNGAIVNVGQMSIVVKDVIDDLEQNFGYEAHSCVTGIGGKYIESLNSHGLVPIYSIGKRDREINEDDIKRVIDAARAIMIPPDRETLQVIPKDFIVNGVNGYKGENVLGTRAVRLEVDVHTITASKTQLSNIAKCVEQAGYDLDYVFLKTLAATSAVMMKEERELGSILIDLGGGTTDVIVIIDDAPVCTLSIPAGGNIVTNDIAYLKGIPLAVAEKLKIESGCCWDELLVGNDSEVVIPAIGGRPPEVTRKSELCAIIQSRMREIFTMVKNEIVQRSGLTQLSGSIILTGGGALMSGVVELAEYTFKTSSVRIGMPGQFGGVEESYRTPEYATAVGLVLSDRGNFKKAENGRRDSGVKKSKKSDFEHLTSSSGEEIASKKGFLSRVKDFFF